MIILLFTTALIFFFALNFFAVFHADPLTPAPSSPPKKKKKKKKKKKNKGTTKPATKKTGDEKAAAKEDKASKGKKDAGAKEEPKELTKKKEIAAQVRVLKQCFLLHRMQDVIRFRHGTGDKAIPHHFSEVMDPPTEVLTKLTAKPKAQRMFELKEHEIALLVPRIRFFRVHLDAKGRTKSEFEFPFRNHSGPMGAKGISPTPTSPLSSQLGQGDRSGIKSFSYDLAGTNPATAQAFITATAEFYFGSLDDLFAPIGEWQGTKVAFSDLIVYNDRPDDYDGDFFTIRVVTGWGNIESDLVESSVKDAIRYAQTSLLLQLVGHELNFNLDGSLTLTVEYNARVETALADSSLNVLWIPELEDVQKRRANIAKLRKKRIATRAERKELVLAKIEFKKEATATIATGGRFKIKSTPTTREISELVRAGGSFDGDAKDVREANLAKAEDMIENNKKAEKELDKDIGKLKEEIEKATGISLLDRYKRILNGLSKWGRLYTIQTDADQIGLFSADSLTSSTSESVKLRSTKKAPIDVKKDSGDTSKADAAKLDEAVAKGEKGKIKFKDIVLVDDDVAPMDESYEVRIPFFFLGDLLDILFQILHDKIGGKTNEKAIRTLEQFSFLVGGIVLKHKGQEKDYLFNLADIPISYDLFKVWFTEKVIQPQLSSYKLTNLFRDIMNSLVVSALGDGCFGGGKNNTIPSFVPLSTQRAEGGKSRLKGNGSRCKMESILNAIPLSDEGSRSAAQTESILYFFAKEDQINYLDGKQSTHEKRGIYHLRIGQSRGIIKDVSFSKTDFKFLRESRIAGSAQETAADGFLREKYDAEITMVGNSLFHPGQLIYIDPAMPGATKGQARKLGFSGYYFVLESFHLVEDQYYQTTIKAVHQGFAGTGGAKFPQAFPSTTKAACGPRNPSDPPPKSVSGGGEGQREFQTRADKARAKSDVAERGAERVSDQSGLTDEQAREQTRIYNLSVETRQELGYYQDDQGIWRSGDVPAADPGAGQPLKD